MPLTNNQIDRITSMYDARRTQAHFELNERRNRIYREIPEIRSIEDKIIEGSVNRARLALQGDESALVGLEETNRLLSEQKAALLISHGYPLDYLEPIYVCKDCKDTGYIGSEKCHCFMKELSRISYDDLTIREVVSRENFANFDLSRYSDSPERFDRSVGKTPRENIINIVNSAKQYIDNFGNGCENLYIYGDTGVGKTFLTNCIVKELMDKAVGIMYFPAYRFFEQLINSRFANKPDSRSESDNLSSLRLEQIASCELLIIDDLGTEVPNALTESILYSCVNERLLRKKSTIISTNLSPDRLRDIYGERTYSRIIQNFKPHKIVGEDIRLQ